MQSDWQNSIRVTSDVVKSLIPHQSQESKLFVPGRSAFGTGNSGSNLFDAVVKYGNECQIEGVYCKLLGEVAPIVFEIVPGGYVMERLQIAPREPDLILGMELLLHKRVWNRPTVPYEVTGVDYKEYHQKIGITVPTWAIPTEFCMTHGDPTVSNAMIRISNRELVICDPRPPRAYIPSCRETDMGRLLTSAFGWEQIAYNEHPVQWLKPVFWDVPNLRRKALFWCAAACKRIAHKEWQKLPPRMYILEWCDLMVKFCFELIGESFV